MLERGTTLSYAPTLPKLNVDAMAFAEAMQTSQGTFQMRVPQIEIYDRPTSNLIVMKGRNAADAADAAVNVNVFNTDAFGEGDGFVATYNDGFSGKNLNRHIAASHGARGLLMKSITFIATNIATGAQDASVLQALALKLVTYTCKDGVVVPKTIDLSAAIRNTQFQSGTLTLDFPEGVWVNSMNQLQAYITSGSKVTANISWA